MFRLNRTRTEGTLHADQYTFCHISLISSWNEKCFVQNLYRKSGHTFFVFSNFFFCENRTVCEKMWKNIVERGMLQMQIWRMRIACLLPKATNTYSHVV